ncbi:50S ribosomal protein L25 [Candidatus Peregrinibacteria bacterium]|nr:50S ribosomal protein L25 [Candidatus Peregrinibacteria bacterium]
MELLELVAKARDTKVKAAAVRRQNLIPAVCYGKEFESKSIQLEYQAFRKAYKQASTTQVISLNIDGDKVPVLIHEIAYNPISDRFDHVDFLQIDLKKKVTATVPVELVGVAPAIKNFNGVVTLAKHEIEVKCLPMDIPHEIKVDVSKLENIGDAIHISDLVLGDRVEILDDLNETLVSVSEVEEFVEKEAAVPEELKAEPTAEGAAAEGGEKAEAAPAEDKKE